MVDKLYIPDSRLWHASVGRQVWIQLFHALPILRYFPISYDHIILQYCALSEMGKSEYITTYQATRDVCWIVYEFYKSYVIPIVITNGLYNNEWEWHLEIFRSYADNKLHPFFWMYMVVESGWI